jgi:Protein of unknown function (DUF2795)
MQRGNTKHGPAHDQEMARETQQMVRGAPKPAHAEEWRQPEPVEDSLPPVRRGDAANPLPDSRDIELRSELARMLTKDLFPVGRDALLARLEDAGAPPDLTERVAALPDGRFRFASSHDVLAALGLSSPETSGQKSAKRA